MKKGIDISYCQGSPDFAKVRGAVDFVIMQIGYGRFAGQIDKTFARNYSECKKHGIPCAGYWFSYATTADEARAMLADPLMVLVNHTSKMPDDYTFDTKECGSATAVNKTLQTVACDAFLSMQKAAAADGVTVWMQSGYRSVKYQTSLYERKTKYYLDKGYDNATAKEKAAAVVNPPGYSEHNCGLAADLNSPEHTGLDEGFEKTAAFRWLCEHAGDYGFILRYPKDAEDKTEIIYEPWHWRYVGVENAAKINASGLCFEEYIETLQSIAAEG